MLLVGVLLRTRLTAPASVSATTPFAFAAAAFDVTFAPDSNVGRLALVSLAFLFSGHAPSYIFDSARATR